MSRFKPRSAVEKKRNGIGEKVDVLRKIQKSKALEKQPIASPVLVPVSTSSDGSKISGVLYAFGENPCGQIGLNPGTVEKRKFPALCEFFNSSNVISVAAGGMHSVVLTSNGEVYTFGCNDEGALGRIVDPDNAEEQSAIPGVVTLPGKATSISAGNCHSAALLEDGTVYYWGTFRDANGQYGLLPGDNEPGKPRYHIAPIKVPLEPNMSICSIASGNEHMVLLTMTGNVLSFGASLDLLGRPFRRTRQNSRMDQRTINLTPSQVVISNRSKFKAIWCGSSSTFCMENSGSGTVWCFGMNSMLQLGIGSVSDKMIEAPMKSTAITKMKFRNIAVGEFHCLGLTDDGKVFTWGKPYEGQLGLGAATPEKAIASPQCVTELTDQVTTIACGHSVSYAITDKREMFAWGFGENWQLGKGETEDSTSPQLVLAKIRGEPARKVLGISGGGQHTLVIAELGLGQDAPPA